MEQKYRVLLAEDERMLAEILCDTLNDRFFDVDLAYDGQQALKMATQNSYDVIVTDIMMPLLDGYSLVKEIRERGNNTPVLFLTARTATEDVVKGFDTGGNDYLRKPFAIDELIARIKALAQRKTREAREASNPTTFQLGKYLFSPKDCTLIEEPLPQPTLKQEATEGGQTGKVIKLAARESGVLHSLCKGINDTVDSSQLLKEHWGNDNFFNLRSLNVYITRLRHHLKDEPRIKITSIRGVGYRLEVLKNR